jgi:hypothetical protein
MMELVEAPFPCSEVPIDYGDVIRVGWVHPWEHSSAVAAAAFDWETGIPFVVTYFAFVVVLGCMPLLVRDVVWEESCPY